MRPVRSGAVPSVVALLAALPSAAFRGEDPPTPDLVRGEFLRALRAHRVEEAGRILSEGVSLLPEPDRAAFDVDRRLLEAANAALASLASLVSTGQKVPPPLGKTLRLRGDVVAADAEGFTLRDGRSERRLRWTELAWRDVADFLSAREPKGAANLVAAGALRVLDGDFERAWKGLTQARASFSGEPEAALASALLDARPALEGGHREAKALEALASIPADAEGEALLAAARAALADAAVPASAAYRRGREALVPRVTRALEGAFSREGVKELFKGGVEPGEGGRIKLRYGFERAEEIGDFVLEPYPAVDDGPWEDLSGKLDPAKVSDWTAREGGLLGAGKASLRHAARFVGDVSVRFSFKALAMAKGTGNEAVLYLFLAGILDDRKGNFVAAQCGTTLVRLKKGIIASLAPPAQPAPVPAFGKVHEFRIEWKGKKLAASLGDKPVHEAPLPDAAGGGVFLWLEGPVSVRIDELAIEGTLDPEWVGAAQKAWVAKRLAAALPEPAK
ncbi:MAG TPA: hypothetical protein VFI25_10990 [Planctomycetota bacterium]|jgi:hypothetical protein|nr:hypothetical protein [Planctomycetota bacterium]